MITNLLLVACGGGDDDDVVGRPGTSGPDTTDAASADAYVQAVAETMLEDQEGGFTLAQETAACSATAIVDAIGVDRLTEAGITPDELAAAEAFDDLDVDLPEDGVAALAEGFADCDLAELLLESVVAELDLSAEARTCLEAAVDGEAVGRAMAVAYAGSSGDDLNTVIGEGFAACPAAMTAYVVAEASVPASAEDEACVRSVVETHPDAVRAVFVDAPDTDDGPDGSDELGALIADSCPDFDVIVG